MTTTLQTANVLGVALGGLLFFPLVGQGHPVVTYAYAHAITLPACAALLLIAAVLVHLLPVTQYEAQYEAQNALIEWLPG